MEFDPSEPAHSREVEEAWVDRRWVSCVMDVDPARLAVAIVAAVWVEESVRLAPFEKVEVGLLVVDQRVESSTVDSKVDRVTAFEAVRAASEEVRGQGECRRWASLAADQVQEASDVPWAGRLVDVKLDSGPSVRLAFVRVVGKHSASVVVIVEDRSGRKAVSFVAFAATVTMEQHPVDRMVAWAVAFLLFATLPEWREAKVDYEPINDMP